MQDLQMFALLTLFTVCKSFDSSNLFRHFLHNLINYWKLLPKLWFYFDPVQYFSAAGVIHNIAVGLCSACWNRVIIHFMISEGPDIMHSLHPVKLNFIRHFLKHILNHQYSQHTPLHAGRQCWGKTILPGAGYLDPRNGPQMIPPTAPDWFESISGVLDPFRGL